MHKENPVYVLIIFLESLQRPLWLAAYFIMEKLHTIGLSKKPTTPNGVINISSSVDFH